MTGRSADNEKEVPAFDGLDWVDSEPGHSAVKRRGDGRFIFMASMVAITCPAVTGLPSVTWRVTVPTNGARTCPGTERSAFSLEVITGSPDALAAAIALALLPASSRMSAGGPTKVIPARAQPSARSGFSDRNPYPG